MPLCNVISTNYSIPQFDIPFFSSVSTGIEEVTWNNKNSLTRILSIFILTVIVALTFLLMVWYMLILCSGNSN